MYVVSHLWSWSVIENIKMCNTSYDIDAITPTTVNSPGVIFCLCVNFGSVGTVEKNKQFTGQGTTGFTNQAAQGKGGGG